MRAYLSATDGRCYSDDDAPCRGTARGEHFKALAEARAILATTEPAGGAQGVTNRHYALDSLGYAGRNLAESLAAFIALEIS